MSGDKTLTEGIIIGQPSRLEVLDPHRVRRAPMLATGASGRETLGCASGGMAHDQLSAQGPPSASSFHVLRELPDEQRYAAAHVVRETRDQLGKCRVGIALAAEVVEGCRLAQERMRSPLTMLRVGLVREAVDDPVEQSH